MDFAFATTGLRSLCERRRKAMGALGVIAARELGQKLADLEACETVGEYADTFGPLVEVSPDERGLQLNCGLQLTFKCGHLSTPVTATNDVDWAQVTKIKITSLESAND